ncbi:MAG: hypothetical protein R3B90_11990 [Planctomycetaceae bacterium]
MHRREGGPIVGVLVMTVKLGDIRLLDIDVGGEVERQAVLVDVRNDWQNLCGTVVQHPQFREEWVSSKKVPLVEEGVCKTLLGIRGREAGHRSMPEIDQDFYDPVLETRRIAAIAPVAVRQEQTGWFVIVAEPTLAE